MSGRPWTDEDRDLLGKHYKRRPTRWIAAQLQRSETAVRLQADALGLVRRRKIPAGLLEFIRERHAAGLLDTQIHAEWLQQRPDASDAVSRESIRNYRRALGLPVNADSRLAVRRAGHQKQLRTMGIAGLQILAQRRHRRVALQAGLPSHLRPLEVRVLQVLLRGGYWTRQQIAAEIGNGDRQRSWFKTKYGSGSALANLVQYGFVRRTQRRTHKDDGKGRTAYEYWVPLDALQRLEQGRRRTA